MRPSLPTARLVLVPQTLAAARALLEGADPGLPLAPGYPHADTLDALAATTPHASGDEGLGWFVTLAEDDRVIGDLGTKGWVDDAGRVEIGYGLAEGFRRQGYGGEAVQALVNWLGEQPGVEVVTAEVEVGNLASRRLLERLGFGLDRESDGCWWFTRPVVAR